MPLAQRSLLVAAAIGCSLLGCHRAPPSQTAVPTAGPRASVLEQDSIEIDRANRRFVDEKLKGISGRETQRSDSVFKNVKLLGAAPARTLLTIMYAGYARALGVKCTHCHVEQDFASDEKRPKRAAREMAVMHRMINAELAKMDNLATPKTQNRAINCSTCHRGKTNPMAP